MSGVVTGIAISSLPEATTPLVGDELVPIVQDGVTRQTTAAEFGGSVVIPDGSVTNIKLADMAEATVKGRELGTGTGPPVDLTETQLGDLVWEEFQGSDRRAVNDVGYRTLPQSIVGGAGDFALSAGNSGGAVRFTTTGAHSVLVDDQGVANYPQDMVFTIVNIDPGSEITIQAVGAATFINLADGTVGTFKISGVGIATIYLIDTDQWTIHGANVVPA